jgi:hypothetical protein
MKNCENLNIKLCPNCEDGWEDYCYINYYYNELSIANRNKNLIKKQIERFIIQSGDYLSINIFYVRKTIEFLFPQYLTLLEVILLLQ